jgi:hypothetical protein
MLVEDDMVWCNHLNKKSALAQIFDAIDHANTVADDWTGVRVGYGGNGLVRACVHALHASCICLECGLFHNVFLL